MRLLCPDNPLMYLSREAAEPLALEPPELLLDEPPLGDLPLEELLLLGEVALVELEVPELEPLEPVLPPELLLLALTVAAPVWPEVIALGAAEAEELSLPEPPQAASVTSRAPVATCKKDLLSIGRSRSNDSWSADSSQWPRANTCLPLKTCRRLATAASNHFRKTVRGRRASPQISQGCEPVNCTLPWLPDIHSDIDPLASLVPNRSIAALAALTSNRGSRDVDHALPLRCRNSTRRTAPEGRRKCSARRGCRIFPQEATGRGDFLCDFNSLAALVVFGARPDNCRFSQKRLTDTAQLFFPTLKQ
jgi:hypothetical protein